MSAVRCPLCATEDVHHFAAAYDIEYFTTPRRFNFFRCAKCDVLFIYPMLFNRLSEIYPANYYSFKSMEVPSMAFRIKRFIDERTLKALARRLTGTSLSALDVGGGSGWILNDLRTIDSRFRQTTVVDVDGGAEQAARSNGHDFQRSTIENYETDRRFDLILMLNLLEHVSDPVFVLSKMRGLLNPGGLVWIKTPNYVALDARLFRNRCWGGYHTPRHFVLFSRPSLIRLCEAAGFRILYCRYTQGAPFWTVSVINELRAWEVTEVSARRPSIENPLTPFLHMTFAMFDFMRMPFSKTSQMNICLTRSA